MEGQRSARTMASAGSLHVAEGDERRMLPTEINVGGNSKENQESCVCLGAQSCLTLCDPMDYSLPVSSVRGILQARILEWVAMPSST